MEFWVFGGHELADHDNDNVFLIIVFIMVRQFMYSKVFLRMSARRLKNNGGKVPEISRLAELNS